MNDNEEYDVEETPETAEMAELLRNLPGFNVGVTLESG